MSLNGRFMGEAPPHRYQVGMSRKPTLPLEEMVTRPIDRQLWVAALATGRSGQGSIESLQREGLLARKYMPPRLSLFCESAPDQG